MEIYDVKAGRGRVGVAAMPGLLSPLEQDVAAIAGWGADLVLSMVGTDELARAGCDRLGPLLAARGIEWIHLPVDDYGAPGGHVTRQWSGAATSAHALLDNGGRVLAHCRGGCGRSGMAALRLLVERGEAPEQALGRLRAVRPCAVEARGQYAWAAAGRPQAR